jgi:hypothetical protein
MEDIVALIDAQDERKQKDVINRPHPKIEDRPLTQLYTLRLYFGCRTSQHENPKGGSIESDLVELFV